jgi:hypothetical protein
MFGLDSYQFAAIIGSSVAVAYFIDCFAQWYFHRRNK